MKKTSDQQDKILGMGAKITRRDFVQASATVPPLLAAGSSKAAPASSAYPPSLQGMRGSHDGSFEAAHELARDGRTDWRPIQDTEEHYDLIVVGAGVSGLSAAYFFRKQNPDARILVLDNHDDFGGHAKRNEFTANGRSVIGYGGSQSMEAPSEYSDTASQLLKELAVDTDAFYDYFDQEFFKNHGLSAGIYFDKATYGRETFVPASDLVSFIGFDQSQPSLSDSIDKMPLSDQARAELRDLVDRREDKVPDVGLSDLAGYLSSKTYEKFLREDVGVQSEQLVAMLRRLTTGYFGYGTDITPAMDAMAFGLPGITKLGVPGAKWLLGLLAGAGEPYIFHFPDGNASIARALVRSLIPTLSTSAKPEDLLHARFDYALLDRSENSARIRLSSTAVQVKDHGSKVDVHYRHGSNSYKASADKVVLACYNAMIPYLCPDLPTEQKQALAQAVKIPLVYTNVVLNNWRALKAQHMAMAYTPSAFHSYCMVDFPVSLPGYDFAKTVDDPIALHFSEALIQPGLPPKDQSRVGRARLLGTSFEEIERDVRTTLTGILSPGGFDPARDIAGITVNRWPHGYAYTPMPLFDPDYPAGQAPHEIGRRTVGNIAIANSDAGARAYLDEAIDQAHRAVSELT